LTGEADLSRLEYSRLRDIWQRGIWQRDIWQRDIWLPIRGKRGPIKGKRGPIKGRARRARRAGTIGRSEVGTAKGEMKEGNIKEAFEVTIVEKRKKVVAQIKGIVLVLVRVVLVMVRVVLVMVLVMVRSVVRVAIGSESVIKMTIDNNGPISVRDVEERVINGMRGGGRREMSRTEQVTRKRIRRTEAAMRGEREARERRTRKEGTRTIRKLIFG
jgi:hypothetical protein